MGPAEETLEQLRALDRRLLAVEGDLQTRVETVHHISVLGIGKSFHIPDDAELSRLEVELRSVRSELLGIAKASCPRLEVDDDAHALSRTDAKAAYAVLEERCSVLRKAVRSGFEALRAQQSDLRRSQSLADQTGWVEPVPGSFAGRRRLFRVGMTAAIVLLVAGIFMHRKRQLQEVARELCATLPPCEGDAMQIAYAESRGRGQPEFVLFRRTADCSREVEVYFDHEGEFRFRGSQTDPDGERRGSFLRRRESWSQFHEITSRVPCAQVDNLLR